MPSTTNVSDSLPTVTIVTPVFNELKNIDHYFSSLNKLTSHCKQVILVDGGSNDGTYESLKIKINESSFGNNIYLCQTKAGRARQMNYGTLKNTSDVIVFLHFDTRLPDNGLELIEASVRKGAFWGRFDVCFDDRRFVYRVIAYLMNLRSALTSIVTGDQAIFVRGDVLKMVGGYPEIPLMEDIMLSTRLKQVSPVSRIKTPVMTLARRWQENGVWKTIMLMWWIRLAYWLGIGPERLARWYKIR